MVQLVVQLVVQLMVQVVVQVVVKALQVVQMVKVVQLSFSRN